MPVRLRSGVLAARGEEEIEQDALHISPLMALRVHGAMSARSPLSGVKRRSGLGTVRSPEDLAGPLPRRNNSLIRGINVPALGIRAWGDITMTDSESWKERRNQVARYRAMEQETTDPLAARLLHDIVLDLEAELKLPENNIEAAN